MHLGDIFSLVVGVVAVYATIWALILMVALLFRTRAQQARATVEGSPWKSMGLGIVVLSGGGIISAVLFAQGHPLARVLGFLLIVGLLAAGALGGSGLALLLSQRIQAMHAMMSPYQALSRSTLILAIAGLMPILGWFLVTPAILLMSIGAGFKVLKTQPYEAYSSDRAA